ncbi:hypothetical protein GWI33_008322 [Rhynchophorus ferrugineus]|uniref:C2H2-type domain-containing protein n=1 Tax=Rhynchophorus ferrugineus TaxID=354439 RepID=A0A834MNP9_RHYFE|nr:hypothetical protein GWI33_008322 [Rhynchophorus ferrugineus]
MIYLFLRLFVDVKDYNEDPLGNQTERIFEKKFEILNPSKFNIYPCSLCQKVFNSKRKLTAHQKNVHISGRPYKCAKCPKSFKCSTGLNQHQKSHSPRNKIECNICLKSLSTKFSFDLHMRRHNKEYVTKCEQCGMKFISKGELKLHTDSKHERAFLCIECGKRYSSKYSLDYHMQTHDPNFKKVVYKCEKCDSSFDTERNRKRHILKWHRDCPRKEFICDLCGKVLVNLESFKIHILGHNGAKPFECEYCGKKFLRRNTLKWHRNTHTGEKPYQCKICHQSFTQPSPLKRHVIAMHCK